MDQSALSAKALSEASMPFFQWLEEWLEGLEVVQVEQVIPDPHKAAVVSVDVTNGFCYEGPLSSPRVAGIVQPIARLFEQVWAHGVRHIILSQDTHEPDAVEFAQWPPHCVRGTSEAEPVDAFKQLPFFNQIVISEKNSVAPGLNTDLFDWVQAHPEVDTYIVTGDCTDLCTYQLAMFLRLDANARQVQRRVIVPANCVQTYDRPVEVAREQGGLPHPGDLMHAIFLYHMQLNGMEVVAEIA
jgi:nicotinamidase-related amidase